MRLAVSLILFLTVVGLMTVVGWRAARESLEGSETADASDEKLVPLNAEVPSEFEMGAGSSRHTAANARPGDAPPVVGDSAAPETVGVQGWTPCPTDGSPCTILPFGASITDGYNGNTPGGYRVELYLRATGDGRNITFLGSRENGPMTAGDRKLPFPRRHEGHSGWQISQLTSLVPNPALSDSPHIVLLQIGTNDIFFDKFAGANQRLANLVDQLVTNLPDSLIAVASILPLTGRGARYMPQIEAFNAGVKKMANARHSEGKHVIFVDQYSGFPPSEIQDGTHPDKAGYARMADVWYRAVAPYIPISQ
jgi:lysophospholipase L1-like esterase